MRRALLAASGETIGLAVGLALGFALLLTCFGLAYLLNQRAYQRALERHEVELAAWEAQQSKPPSRPSNDFLFCHVPPPPVTPLSARERALLAEAYSLPQRQLPPPTRRDFCRPRSR
jgi:hypothetical protein